MRVLVTGAAGFVGRWLVPLLRSQHDVIAVARIATGEDGLIAIDLADPAFANSLPSSVDAVVHLAQGSGTFPADATSIFDVNVASALRLASYAQRAGAHVFIQASTGSVYAPSLSPLDEEAAVAADEFYPATKLAAENILLPFRTAFAVAIMRLFVPYGPGQSNRMIPRIIEAVRTGQPVTVRNGGQPRTNPIYVEDLCSVVSDALERPYSGVLNVAGPAVIGIGEIAEIAGQALGRTPLIEERNAQSGWNLIADTSRLAGRLPAHEWTSPQLGIRRMLKQGDGHA